MAYQLIQGDCLTVLRTMEAQSVHCCITSPPYFGLRDYGHPDQIGLERTVGDYVSKMVSVFDEVRRVLRDDGTLWLNLGDSYAGSWGNYSPHSPAPLEGWNNTRFSRKAYDDRTWRPANSRPQDGLKPKDLIGIPWRVAFGLQAAGWYLRSDIIWAKPNPMPESVTDRPTKSHEYLFLLAKSEVYFCDMEAIKEPSATNDMRRPYGSQGTWALDGRPKEQRPNGKPRKAGNKTHKYVTEYETSDSEEHRTKAGLLAIADVPWSSRNRRTVWTIATKPYPGAHFATYPLELVEPCVMAGCPVGGVVLDPFSGSGTTGSAAIGLGRDYIGIELNPDYIALAHDRLGKTQPSLFSG